MPIGTSKLGVLGAGLVPGGSVTFNTSGTFSVPPGVKKVSITGRGATGNPGNAGNPGNPGQSGSGGAGGAGGRSRKTCFCTGQFTSIAGGGRGGFASRPDMASRGSITLTPTVPPSGFCPWYNAGTAPPTWVNQVSVGGLRTNTINPAQSGQSGGAGTAGNAGNPGNTGASSSGLGNTFLGGAGGNAGVGGSAGNGGSGGSGGSVGGDAPENSNAGVSGGGGGNGGGSGGNGNYQAGPGESIGGFGGGGGGGAGATNSGFSGENSKLGFNVQLAARGGEDSQVSAPYQFQGSVAFTPPTTPANGLPLNTMGGYGGRSSASSNDSWGSNAIRFGVSNSIGSAGYNNCGPDRSPCRINFPQFTPAPLAPNIIRAGGGGAAAGYCSNILQWRGGGGGGGGGRGNAGNAGGTSSAPSGSAATPQTFNCVPVTPGGSAPITVAAPGGQVVISWNPQ